MHVHKERNILADHLLLALPPSPEQEIVRCVNCIPLQEKLHLPMKCSLSIVILISVHFTAIKSLYVMYHHFRSCQCRSHLNWSQMAKINLLCLLCRNIRVYKWLGISGFVFIWSLERSLVVSTFHCTTVQIVSKNTVICTNIHNPCRWNNFAEALILLIQPTSL